MMMIILIIKIIVIITSIVLAVVKHLRVQRYRGVTGYIGKLIQVKHMSFRCRLKDGVVER